MKRRVFLQQTSMAAVGLAINGYASAGNRADFPMVRLPEQARKFKSPAVEKLISSVQRIGNKEIAWLFNNCFPNTLDTTVDFEIINGKPDTFVITGDIDAMWLRDSSAQVWPYLPLMKSDKNLQELIKGVINRQVKCILKDPYANAFYRDENKTTEWNKDKTDMKLGVHERKWEIDSLCYPIRLAHGYWKETGDLAPFDKDWAEAMRLIVKTFREQQRMENNGPYRFQRETTNPIDSVPLDGYGYPARKIGLIHSMFRPSDDATIYPFLIPSNFFAYHSLEQLAEMSKSVLNDMALNVDAGKLKDSLGEALVRHAIVRLDNGARIMPYEINGWGSCNLMDDANAPGLLSLPYLISSGQGSLPLYRETRKFVLSDSNPFFFKGKVAEGIGGPHVGMDYIWPMSIVMRGLTSNDEGEIKNCLGMLQRTHAGTGFMHESFHKDDASKYTRKWFAWANTLFGELVWKTFKERPHLLNQ